tara:strand:- start:17968 stop:18243 length:276 start_codon:yes stop_codon:yes gene_type:complete
MGKIKQDDLKRLRDSGQLSKSAEKALTKSGTVSTKKTTTERYFKVSDNVYVSPRLYFRGGSKVKPTGKMKEFQAEYQKLMEKYTITKPKGV